MQGLLGWYKSEPRDRNGSVDRFRLRLKRLFGNNYRLVWDPQAGEMAPPGRWTVEEKGHRTGRWQYVWAIQGEDKRYRDPGDWALQHMHSMDTAMCASMVRGNKAAWGKIKSWLDGPRKQRAARWLADWHLKYREEILPRALRRASKMGQIIRPCGLSPEQSVRLSAIGHPGSQKEIERLALEEAAVMGDGVIPARATQFFGSMNDKPSQHQRNVGRGKRSRGLR